MAKMKKNLFAIFLIVTTLLNVGVAVTNYGYGCEIKQGLLMCGSKTKRLDGCYNEVR